MTDAARKLCTCCPPMTEEAKMEMRRDNAQWSLENPPRKPQSLGPAWEQPGYVPEGVEPLVRAEQGGE